MKQTAVEWLYNQQIEYPLGDWEHFFKQAKEMEKKQIIDAWIVTDNELQRIAAEQYYNEQFKKK